MNADAKIMELRAKIATKLLKMREAVGGVPKDRRNDGEGGYRYASSDAVLAKVRPAMIANNIDAYPVYTLIHEELLPAAPGKQPRRFVRMRCDLHVTDCETGFRLEPPPSAIGGGADTGSKADMKAETSSLKYAWFGVLHIDTGDDPEADPEEKDHDAPPAGPQPLRPAAPASTAPAVQPQRATTGTPPPDHPRASTAPAPAEPRKVDGPYCLCNKPARFKSYLKDGRPIRGYCCANPVRANQCTYWERAEVPA